MSTPQITDLPTVPLTSDTDFKTTAPAWLNNLKNITVPELNTLIAYINAASWLDTPLAVASGGTGLSSLTAGRIPYGAGTGDFGNSDNLVYSSGTFAVGGAVLGGGTPIVSFRQASTGGFNRNLLQYSAESAPTVFHALTTSSYIMSLSRRLTDGVFPNISRAACGSLFVSDDGDSYITFATAASNNINSTERLRIDKDGNIGIGTAAPAKKLEVEDDSGAQLRLTDSAGNYVDFRADSNGDLEISPSAGVAATAGAASGSYLRIKIGGTFYKIALLADS